MARGGDRNQRRTRGNAKESADVQERERGAEETLAKNGTKVRYFLKSQMP